MKYKILFILKNSKTKTTGYYQMNRYVESSLKLKETYNTKIINLYSDSNSKILNLVKLILYSWSILYCLFTFRPRLVYFTISPVNAFYRDLIYVFILKLFNLKVIYHLHGKGISKKANSCKINLRLYRWAYKNVDVIIVSEKLKYDIDFLPVKSIQILPNAIPIIPLSQQLNQSSKKGKRPLNLLFLSNLIKSKGIYDFIESIHILKMEGLNIRANIVGKEYEVSKEELKLRFSQINDIVTFHGPLYGEEKNKILTSSDILVFPTYSDIWGIVILEAMQFGLAVITTDEGAITDMIIDRQNGYIVNKRNPKNISEKIKEFYHNPQLIVKMGNLNRKKFLKNYTIRTFEEGLVNIITNAAV